MVNIHSSKGLFLPRTGFPFGITQVPQAAPACPSQHTSEQATSEQTGLHCTRDDSNNMSLYACRFTLAAGTGNVVLLNLEPLSLLPS